MNTRALDIAPKWHPQLVIDLALETHTLEDLLDKYDLTAPALEALYSNDTFRKTLLQTKQELASSGSIFRTRARAIAEMHLETVHNMLEDPEVAAQTKVSLYQAIVKYANLEPKKEESETSSGKPSINIQINI